MIEVYIWEPGEFRIGSGVSTIETSDWMADWKKALGHASMYISSEDIYLSLWPDEETLEGLPKLKKLTGAVLNSLQTVYGPGVIKESLQEDIEGMQERPKKSYELALINESAVAEAAAEYIDQIKDGKKNYNLVTNNCSTAVFNALYTGTMSIERDRVKDLKAFGSRAYNLMKNTAILTGGGENFTRLEAFQTQGWEPLKLAFALQEISTFRTPLSIVEYIEGMKIFNK